MSEDEIILTPEMVVIATDSTTGIETAIPLVAFGLIAIETLKGTADGVNKDFVFQLLPPVAVFIDNRLQKPDTYSISGTTLTFHSAPGPGAVIQGARRPLLM